MPTTVRSCVLAALVVSGAIPSRAVGQATPVVKVNLGTRLFESVPPFDEFFVLSAAVRSGVRGVRLQYGAANADGTGFLYAKLDGDLVDYAAVRADGLVSFRIAPLRPNVRYRFALCASTQEPPNVPSARCDGTGETLVPVLATATADITKHFDTDFGVLWSPPPGPAYVGAGTNVHFYAVPINKNEAASELHGPRNEILKRVSVFAGIAFAKLHSSRPVEPQFTSVGNLLLGVGVRPRTPGFPVLDFLRLNGGVMFFMQRDANVAVSDDHTQHAPFVSLTGDISLQGVLGPLAGLIGIKK